MLASIKRAPAVLFTVGALVCLTLGMAATGTAHAATALTVSDCSGEYGNGGTSASPAAGSLAYQVNQANSDNAGDTIGFSCGGTISITGTLGITGSMTIDGTGHSITLDGGNSVQLLSVSAAGSLGLTNLTLQHGSAVNRNPCTPCEGGAINNAGTLTITSSTLSGNSATFGGAIYNHGGVVITGSTLSGNSAGGGPNGSFGGAIWNDGGTLSITGSTFTGNSIIGTGFGGAIANSAGLSITDSTFTGNTSDRGGAIWNDGGTLSITGSTFTGNSIIGTGFGGAIDSEGSATIVKSTFTGNSAGGDGGAIANSGPVCVICSNFPLILQDSTLVNNSAGNSGGAIANVSSAKVFGNIVAGNQPNNCFNDTADVPQASINDQGYNLESSTDCGFTGTGSLQNTNPGLAALANNGGPTQTMALQAGSPANDVIPAASCPAADQRGVSRPDNGETACDIGAYEFADYPFTGFLPPVANPPAVNMVNAGQSIPLQFQLGGNQGMNIIAAGYPTAQQVSCASGAPINTSTETDTAGSSGLQYNATTGTYTYVWKTSKASKGTCQVFTLKLNDGTTHTANFQYVN